MNTGPGRGTSRRSSRVAPSSFIGLIKGRHYRMFTLWRRKTKSIGLAHRDRLVLEPVVKTALVQAGVDVVDSSEALIGGGCRRLSLQSTEFRIPTTRGDELVFQVTRCCRRRR